MKPGFVQLNYVFANGLIAINAKRKKRSQMITVYITDLTNPSRIIFDGETKKLIVNRDAIELTVKDIEGLFAEIEKKQSAATVAVGLQKC